MKFSVVIGHHNSRRRPNLDDILVQVRGWADVERVIVWNNSGERLPQLGAAAVVDCPGNPVHGRYLAALIYPETELWLFQDDDLIISEHTAKRLLLFASVDGEAFCGVEGRAIAWDSDQPYTHCRGARWPDRADMVVRVYACHRKALIRGFTWILENGISPGRSEPAVFSMGHAVMVSRTNWQNLEEYGVGLSHEPDHWTEQDRFINAHLRKGRGPCSSE